MDDRISKTACSVVALLAPAGRGGAGKRTGGRSPCLGNIRRVALHSLDGCVMHKANVSSFAA